MPRKSRPRCGALHHTLRTEVAALTELLGTEASPRLVLDAVGTDDDRRTAAEVRRLVR